MDIFGTITNTIDLADRIVTYVQAVKGAKEDRRKLHLEVSALGDLLKALHNHFDNTNANENDDSIKTLVMAGIRDPLLRCYEDLEHTVEELERIASPTNTGKSPSLLERMKDITWPFRQEDIKTILGRIERLKSLISLALQTSLTEFVGETRNELRNVGLNVEGIEAAVSALETAQKVHMKSLHTNLRNLVVKSQDSASGIAKIEDKVDRMQAGLITVKEGVHNQELEDLVKWLSPLDFSEKHNTIFERRARDTGKWFLGHQKFLAWRRGECEMLWCPGNPGVGKSVMVSLVINELREELPENTALVFIYFEYKTKYTASQLAEVILTQLARRRITQSGLESLRKWRKAGNHPTSDKLFDILKAEVESYDRVFVVIDALDEADTEIWTQLLGCLRPLRGISLIATSRDTGEIEFGLRPYERLDITVDEEDVRKYIEGRLESSGKFKRLLKTRRGVHEEIVAGIMNKADGMFLLARLHMNSLETKLRITDLRRALDELPNTLDATYDEAMSRISNDNEALAHRVISWLIHAAQPMTIRDLQYALAVEDGMTAIDDDDLHDEAALTSVCVGLVVLREDAGHRTSSKVVGLVHYTTQEYFLHNPSVSARFADSPIFAITCLKFLAFDFKAYGRPELSDSDLEGDESPNERLMKTPFFEYAMFFWGVHAHAHCDDETVKDLAMELLHNSQRVVAVGSFPCHVLNPSAIDLCTHFGLKDYLEYLLDHGYDINSRDLVGYTAVSYAALEGQEEIMRLLLAREGVDVNLCGNSGDTPIMIAAQGGHGDIMKLLLAQDGVDINSRGWDKCPALSIAAHRGHEAIVRLLLARDDLDVNPRDNHGDTPITSAAKGGHNGIVELLLARGVDIHSRGQSGCTPLSAAAGGGHEMTVRILLARDGLDVNPRDDDGDTPIVNAARGGHSGIVELLLVRGVDINSRGRNGRTPLSVAAGGGHEVTVQLLLARDDLDVDPRDDSGNTPIINAARGGHSGIVELLLVRGVNVNSRGRNGRTPLSVAADEGHEVTVQLLLARDDLDVDSRDDDGNTPIIKAAWDGHSGTVKLLLARGVDVNSRGQSGCTLLSAAAGGGHEATAQLLLARDDLDIDLRDDDGDTPIIYAVWGGCSGIMELLLARGVDVNSRGESGCTPLSVATSEGHEAIVQLLLARDDLDVDPRDDSGNTPIIYAAWGGRKGIVELLLARGVDVNSRGQDGFTPLSAAAIRGHKAVVQLLLARSDLDVDSRDNYGDTPIIDAARDGHKGIVKLLLARGVDVNSRGQNGDTALSAAIRPVMYGSSLVFKRWKQEATVRFLLANANLDRAWRGNDGRTYLAVAAYNNSEEAAKWFLSKADTNVNSKNSDGDSPLSLAARQGSDEVVKLLLDQDGIDVNSINSDGKTPLDYAIRGHHKYTFELLRAVGGRTARKLGVKPREDVEGGEDDDTTDNEYMTADEDEDTAEKKGQEW